MSRVCDWDWVTHCRWMHRWFCAMFILFSFIVFLGQWNRWIYEYLFFNEKSYDEPSDYNGVVQWLTNAMVITFLQYGLISYCFYYIEDKQIHKKMLILNNFIWICWLIWDFYFISKLTIFGNILNLSASIPTFIWIVIVDIKLIRDRDNDQ